MWGKGSHLSFRMSVASSSVSMAYHPLVEVWLSLSVAAPGGDHDHLEVQHFLLSRRETRRIWKEWGRGCQNLVGNICVLSEDELS